MGDRLDWRAVAVSVPGTSHTARGEPCADASDYRQFPLGSGSSLLVLVVADGAGSAALGGLGAKLACDSVLGSAKAWADSGRPVSALTAADARDWVSEARAKIEMMAGAAVDPPRTARDYACTLLFAVIGDDVGAFAQVGDGAIVRRSGGALVPVFWPDSGEYANCTYFVTDQDCDSRIRFDSRDAVDAVALFTDGLQALALHYATRSAHAPFFGPMFQRLDRTASSGLDELNEALREFLDSAAVNSRTDDDKTIVLAARVERPASEPES